MSQLWLRKYIPKKTSEIEAQSGAMRQVEDFIRNYSKQKKNAVIIYGPTGCGKTAAVHTLGNEFNYEVLEINASDFRNAEIINSVLGNATKQKSFFYKGKIILVDEIDGLSGKEDRGGIQAIAKIVDETNFPIIMTANDPFDKKFSALRKKAIIIEFEELGYPSVLKVLEKICKEEKVCFTPEALKKLAIKSSGDLRGAINDLQTLTDATKQLTLTEIDDVGDRQRRETIITALIKIFKTTQPEIALSALDKVDENLDEVMLWVDENLPKEYTKPEDLANAYYYLSRADIMRRRIRRWQHWRFQVYISQYLTAGIALSKQEKYRKMIKYERTQRILTLWKANMRYKKRNAIAEKIAERTHTSKKRILQDTLPYVRVMAKEDKRLAKEIQDNFRLDDDEMEWLRR